MINPDPQIRDSFVNSAIKPVSKQEDIYSQANTATSDNSSQVVDVFQSQASKDELIKQIDQLISSKEDELRKIDQEINEITMNQAKRTSDQNHQLQEYLSISDKIRLENLNMQKEALQNQLRILNLRKQEVMQQKAEEERNIQQMQQILKNNYDISLDQLQSLRKQLELYQSSMNDSYKRQIEVLNDQIAKIQKEIDDLLNQQPSTPEEAEQIAQKIKEKRDLISSLKQQIDLASTEISNINNQINQQLQTLDQQIADMKKLKQVDYYQKWALDQAMRREIENIIWGEMMNEKAHIANLWKMYYDTNQKLVSMWKDMYFKKVADEADFVARWSAALKA